jgi:hypothetical protein
VSQDNQSTLAKESRQITSENEVEKIRDDDEDLVAIPGKIEWSLNRSQDPRVQARLVCSADMGCAVPDNGMQSNIFSDILVF